MAASYATHGRSSPELLPQWISLGVNSRLILSPAACFLKNPYIFRKKMSRTRTIWSAMKDYRVHMGMRQSPSASTHCHNPLNDIKLI